MIRVICAGSAHRCMRRRRRRLRGLRRVPGDPLPALGCGKGARQDAVDIPDRLRRQRPTHMRLASGALAVVIPAARSPRSRRSITTSPATTAVRPCRRTTSPSSARTARACCSVATRTPCRALISWTEGSASPAASIPELTASLRVSATCCQAGRRLAETTLRVGTFLCSTNRLPVHPGSLHRRSCA